MLIILFMRYEYSWRRGSNIGMNIIFLGKKKPNNNRKERTWDFIVMFSLNAPHIIIWSRTRYFVYEEAVQMEQTNCMKMPRE